MKLLYDLSAAQPQGDMLINGGGEYAYTVFLELYNNLKSNDIMEVLLNKNRGKSAKIIEFCNVSNIRILYFDENSDINNIIKNENYNKVFFPVCYAEYADLCISDDVAIYTVIHDLCGVYYSDLKVKYGRYPNLDHLNFLRKIRERLKKNSNRKKYIELHNKLINLNNNQKIITDTYYSKSTMELYLESVLNKDIEVLYAPEKRYNSASFDISKVLKKYNLQEKKYFFLSAGCRWTKNNAIAIFTLDKMFSEHKYKELLHDYKVILIGTNNYYKDYFEYNVKNKERFIFEGYIEDDVLESLYSGAQLFIFPSVLEGFGLPPLEAMKHGTIVACSTSMSIPEVCGDAAIYFDPFDERSIEMAILRSFDKDYIKYIRENMEKRLYSLDKTREENLKYLIDIVINQDDREKS